MLLVTFSADPPEEIIVRPPVVIVNEGEPPSKIMCEAKAFPAVTYTWKHGNNTVNIGPELNLDFPIGKSQSGDYICHASNAHGVIATVAKIDVQCKKIQQHAFRQTYSSFRSFRQVL